uniref:Uncharacterized protein n=1 Tax=Paramoeba aestuarina TaxID=180227 RepID=A0A7S4UZ26_9EUKA|mmetsp:Transcript_7870/g.11880  ORF Transcript_7870/g.11880 Transcript_7870/m.11880 type:complete len:260 (+) Transcript_7870:44-823(+)
MASACLSHPKFHLVPETEEQQQRHPLTDIYRGSVVSLLSEMKEDQLTHGKDNIHQFVFFDFDDTLHHTITAAKLYYFSQYSHEELEKMREEMEGEGVFFNPEDPPFHPWMLNFLTELKNECGNIFILSAGSGIQTGYDEKGEKNIEFTLMSNYARCWANAYNVPIFNVFGADPSLLSPSSSPYISPAALSFKNQIDPPEQQQKIISFLLAYLERKKQDLSSSSPSTSSSFYSQPFTLSTEEIEGGGEKMENVLCLVEKN